MLPNQYAAHTMPYIREFPLIESLPALMRRDPLGFILRLTQQGDVCGVVVKKRMIW